TPGCPGWRGTGQTTAPGPSGRILPPGVGGPGRGAAGRGCDGTGPGRSGNGTPWGDFAPAGPRGRGPSRNRPALPAPGRGRGGSWPSPSGRRPTRSDTG